MSFVADYIVQKPILIQQHADESSFFDRSWNEFRIGFGNPSGNFWLGNEQIHQLTKDGGCKLRFDLQLKYTQVWYWVEYSTFIVANETNNYQLTVGGFSGELTTDAFGEHNGNRFVTHDRGDFSNCAATYRGGFWLCGTARVNSYIHYFKWPGMYGNYNLMYSQMWLECP